MADDTDNSSVPLFFFLTGFNPNKSQCYYLSSAVGIVAQEKGMYWRFCYFAKLSNGVKLTS